MRSHQAVLRGAGVAGVVLAGGARVHHHSLRKLGALAFVISCLLEILPDVHVPAMNQTHSS